MTATINLKKRKRGWLRELIVVLSAIILTTISIKASDNFFNQVEEEKVTGAPCPEDMVLVLSSQGNFCIDKFEASPGRACPNHDPANQTASRINLDTPDCQPISISGAIPWRNISQNQAALACAKAGKRLPTSDEWLAAALGTPDLRTGWTKHDCQVANNWETQPGLTGSGKNCISSAGAYDMIGNVWEWVEGTVYNGEYQGQVLPKQGFIAGIDENGLPTETDNLEGFPDYYFDYFWIKTKGARGMARGGYWNNQSDAGQYALYVVIPPSFAGVGIGFRCAK